MQATSTYLFISGRVKVIIFLAFLAAFDFLPTFLPFIEGDPFVGGKPTMTA